MCLALLPSCVCLYGRTTVKSRFAPLDTTRYPETCCPSFRLPVLTIWTPTDVRLFAGMVIDVAAALYTPAVVIPMVKPAGPAPVTADLPDPVFCTVMPQSHVWSGDVPVGAEQVTVDELIVSVAELVNVPNRPNTKPATAMAAMRVIAIRITVARTGLIALRCFPYFASFIGFVWLLCLWQDYREVQVRTARYDEVSGD